MKHVKTIILLITVILGLAGTARPFCGFYVATAGAELYNNRSQVILVRDGNSTVITMSNDFQGNVRDFAMVVPVPVVLKKEMVKVVDPGIFKRLDAYSGPRLVEYYDQNPCIEYDKYLRSTMLAETKEEAMADEVSSVRREYHVTIEEQYSVGEYDIIVLSAKESSGLKRWLIDNEYKIPEKAERVLEPYIKSNMKFFVVKVNLDEVAQTGFNELRPLQIRFESDRFMLPLRLGMANSRGEQDMIVYAFTRTGRVEASNYRTVNIPTARKIPTFVREKFGDFYRDLFQRQYEQEGKDAVFLEYAWNVTPTWPGAKCDPCVGPPPVYNDFIESGVSWVTGQQPGNVFFTRLHVRYSEALFPEDLFFIVTPNTEHFQGRYILTNPANGDLSCDDGKKYTEELLRRRKNELSELAALTGWDASVYGDYIQTGSGVIKQDDQSGKQEFTVVPLPGTRGPGLPAIMFVFSFIGILVLLTRVKTVPGSLKGT